MAKRLRARVGLTYPMPGSSLATVKRAGGVSKLTPEQRAKVKFKRVEVGEWCDDLPVSSRSGLVASGKVEEVETQLIAPAIAEEDE